MIGSLPAERHGARVAARLQLVVADAQRLARSCRAWRRGAEIQVIDERDGGTFFGFADPDGNTWAVQQIKVRARSR